MHTFRTSNDINYIARRKSSHNWMKGLTLQTGKVFLDLTPKAQATKQQQINRT